MTPAWFLRLVAVGFWTGNEMRISKIAVACALAALAPGVAATKAQATFVATMTQTGSNVVLSGSGTINTAGFVSPGYAVTGGPPGVIAPTTGFMIGVSTVQYVDYYSPFTGPSRFGTGSATNASSGSGDRVGLRTDAGNAGIAVPIGYTSGSFLSSSSTYAGATFASLGVTQGSYVWTWGSGQNADSFTLNITNALPAPEPATLVLFGTSLAALGWIRRRRT